MVREGRRGPARCDQVHRPGNTAPRPSTGPIPPQWQISCTARSPCTGTDRLCRPLRGWLRPFPPARLGRGPAVLAQGFMEVAGRGAARNISSRPTCSDGLFAHFQKLPFRIPNQDIGNPCSLDAQGTPGEDLS
jgi:hypothetical protein